MCTYKVCSLYIGVTGDCNSIKQWHKNFKDRKKNKESMNEGRGGLHSVMQWRLFRPDQIITALPEAADRWLSLVCEYVCRIMKLSFFTLMTLFLYKAMFMIYTNTFIELQMQHFWKEVYVFPQDSKANARESKWTTLAELSQYSHYRSLLAGMQPDAAHMHKHSHTLQDRRYRARFSYKFPLGEHQTPPVVWRSSPPRLFHSPSLAACSSIFILSIFFLVVATQVVFPLHFIDSCNAFSNNWHLSRNV